MKNNYGNQPRCRAFGIITHEEFATLYNQMSDGENLLIKASTVEFLKDSNGCQLYKDEECKMPLVTGLIFYDYHVPDNRQLDTQTGKVQQPPVQQQSMVM